MSGYESKVIIFARNMYKKMNVNNNVKSQVDLKKGLYLGQSTDGKNEDIFINWKDLAGNVSIQGDTGVGKSMAMAIFLKQCIFEGKNIILLDSNGSDTSELLSLVLEFASEAGRNDDLKYVSLLDSNKSIKFNPLFGLSNEEISSLISGLIPSTDQFFVSLAYTMVMAITTAFEFLEKSNKNLKVFPNRSLITLSDIHKYSRKKELENILNAIENVNVNKGTDLSILKKHSIKLISEFTKQDNNYFNQVFSSFQVVMKIISTDTLGEIFSSIKNNPILDGFKNDEKGQILIVKSNYEIKEYSSMINQFLFSMLISEYGRIYVSGEIFSRDMFLFIDELNYKDSYGLEQLYNKAGVLGLRIISSSQAAPMLNNYNDEDIAKIIYDNVNTKIFMKMNNPTNENNSINLIEEDIKSLKRREFVIQSSRLATKGILPIQEKSGYIIDKDDWLSPDLNSLYIKFKSLVTNEILQQIVKKGLEDISKYKFKDNDSILPSVKRNIQAPILKHDADHLQKKFGTEYVDFKKINLKDHTLNVFEAALNKFKNMDKEKRNSRYELALVASLFHDFGKATIIREMFLEEAKNKDKSSFPSMDSYREENERLSHSMMSYKYIQKILRKDFSNEIEILNDLSEFVKKHHHSNEAIDSGAEYFISASDFKARTIEKFILDQDIDFERSLLSERLLELDKKFEESKLAEIDFYEKKNKTFDFSDPSSFKVYHNNNILYKIARNYISHMKFDYKISKWKNKYVVCDIVMNNGHTISIVFYNKEEDIEKILEYV